MAIDLFEHWEKQPKKLRQITDKYSERYAEGEMDYKDTEQFLKEVEAEGYTFDYYLDNVPFALRKKGVKLEEVEGFEEMAQGGEVNGQNYFDNEWLNFLNW